MSFRWSDEKTILFLEIYKNYPCLWDNRSDTYHKANVREKAYNNLLQDLQLPELTVHDIKAKIKTIRTRYCAELAKIRKSDRSGAGTDDIYIPRLIWFKEADSFLRAVCTPKSSNSNMKKLVTETNDINPQSVETEQEENEFKESQNMETQNDLSTEQLFTDNNNSADTAVPSSSATAVPSPSVTPTATATPTKHPKKRKSMDSINEALNKLKKISDDNNSAKQLHEFDVFCNSLAIQLKKMPLQRALICQERLQAVMTQERLSSLLSEETSAVTPITLDPSSPSEFSNTCSSVPSYGSNNTSYVEGNDVLTQAIYSMGGLTPNY